MRTRNIVNWNFRPVIFLIVVALASGLFSMTTAGQSSRARRVNLQSPNPEAHTEQIQSPRPVSDPATGPESQPQAPARTPDQRSPHQPDAPQNPAQQPQQPKQDPQKTVDKTGELDAEPIRINSTLVTVPVSVTDANGVPVRNLRVEDFFLEEEGTPQTLQSLGEPGKTPLELTLLFDVSRSIRNKFDFEREAAGRFLRQVLKPGDTVTVFSIGSKPKLSIERSDNAETAIAATMSIEPTDDATAFFDTVVKAARHLSDGANPNSRHVMVVISDGEDTNSERFNLMDAVRELQTSDALFYAINPSGPSIKLNRISTRGHEGMARLSSETGGMTFLPEKLEDLNQVFSQITAELQAQYLLGYYSTNEATDGKFRRINVKVPNHPYLRIRARKGYYAPKE
jgi:Ca-activated chloride channel family protein